MHGWVEERNPAHRKMLGFTAFNPTYYVGYLQA